MVTITLRLTKAVLDSLPLKQIRQVKPNGTNFPSRSKGVHVVMAGTTVIIKGFLSDLSTLMLPKIVGEPAREAFVELHRIISTNAASVASKIGEGIHVHLALTMAAEDYMDQTGNDFVPPHNPCNYPPMRVTAQEHALGTDKFQQN